MEIRYNVSNNMIYSICLILNLYQFYYKHLFKMRNINVRINIFFGVMRIDVFTN